MTIQKYLETLHLRYQTGISREHTYRGDLQSLLMAILPDVLVTNEPARVACGAPDYMLTRKGVPSGYIEAKDIGVDLQSKTLKEQFDRYRLGLPNLIFTDYLDFHFYKDGIFTTKISIAKVENGNIVSVLENFSTFENLIKNFAETVSQTIKSPTKLAEMMAGKAKLMADVIERSLDHDDETETRSNLKQQMLSFKQMLIHDINNSAFADIYAQTIAYGMFAARYHDPTLPTFSRQEAATLIPKSNPFLRKLFQEIAGYDLDHRLVWMVDELVNIFLATDVADIMRNFGRSTKQEDPVVHFYETFLAAYNPALRKAKGVWYTPQPVVNFIVRAVDDILKTEFHLPQGLADTSKIKIKRKHVTKATSDQRSKLKEVETEEEIHRVQILDPATGTGTFLAEVVKHIYKKFEGQQGIWSTYVDQHLIPRLNGFELLMASYAMAHLKMDMLLTETGYKATGDQRFRIFLTNSLEEASESRINLFSQWLSDEANHANVVKNETPVMVIIGNPPYSGESSNKSDWIMKLMEDYKREPGGKEKLKEKNSKFINDDYVKFLRFGQYFIEKNENGILAFINPHGFLDNPTFRGMRWSLLKTYDKIYTIDLHGNTKKNEVAKDGSLDENVFDIMQGVSINFLVKTGKKEHNDLGKVYHFDLYGKRNFKYKFLSENSISSITYSELTLKSPNLLFVNKNLDSQSEYDLNFSIHDLFYINSLGFLSKKDKFIIDFDKYEIKSRLEDLMDNAKSDDQIAENYGLKIADNDKWNLNRARSTLKREDINEDLFKLINYRCFDTRYIYYHSEFVARLNTRVLSNLNGHVNHALISVRQLADSGFSHIFLSTLMSDQCFISNKTKEGCIVYPLYIFRTGSNQVSFDHQEEKFPNLNLEIVAKIAESVGLSFNANKETEDNETFGPLDLLDYIYAILHSTSYREKYKEFLKIDFPRVPYPTETKQFWQLVRQGKKLREFHLLESEGTEKYITQYPIDGNNEVVKPNFFFLEGEESPQLGRVYINENQFFDFVPKIAWEFYIGGYQPAQKWLKDRKGRVLEFDDILHYQKIIVALTRTSEIMQEIDSIMLI